MIIDLILDRKDGEQYTVKEFLQGVKRYSGTWPEMCKPIIEAFESGQDINVKRQLCLYIDNQGYNPKIKDYINGVNWLPCEDSQYAVSNLTTIANNIASYCSYARVNDYAELYTQQEKAQRAIIRLARWIERNSI